MNSREVYGKNPTPPFPPVFSEISALFHKTVTLGKYNKDTKTKGAKSPKDMKGGFDMDNRQDEFERKYGDAGNGGESTAAGAHAGATGVSGASGTAGTTDTTGAAGAPGASGATGTFSTTGAAGGVGATGTPGGTGPAGAPGNAGPGQYAGNGSNFGAQTGAHTPSGADGTYSMTRPANGTTYFRPPQSETPSRGNEWSNTGSAHGAWTNDGRQGYTSPADQPYANPPHFSQYPNQEFVPPQSPDAGGKKKKEKKRGRGIPAGVAAVMCAACIVLSGAGGYLGARLALDNGEEGSYVQTNDGNPVVLYRSVSTDSDAESEASLRDVIKSVENSVVEITTEFKSAGYFQYVSSGAGSGVIISEDGYIITNNHVISDGNQLADSIMVRLKDGTTHEAVVVGRDSDTDIAVIKVDASGLTASVFGDSDSLYVGQDIIAIGNPLGELGGTVTEGIISALDREVDVEGVKMNLLQISAAVNPGNSGGGLFNMKGELVGIINAKSSGSGIEGLGFAIPSLDAQRVAEELMTNGYVTGKPYLGVSFYYAADELTAYRYFRSQAPGLYVYSTVEGYNDKVLMQGDRLVEINGSEVVTQDDVVQVLKDSKIGDELNFIVYREGKRTELKVTVYEYRPDGNDVNFES